MAVTATDAAAPVLPKMLASFGIAVGALALASGGGYVLGVVVLPTAIGISVTFGCAVFAAFGVQLARRDAARRSRSTLAASAFATTARVH